ncbi:YIP1 family protein [Acholeplasma sp. OttesenSCG-928-E16]|nr:YIP1 family protein [Acholeplasma sp. OttesenSCG-928-E16]
MSAKLKLFWFNFFKFPGRLITHPFDGFDELKREKKGKLSVALIFIALYAILRIVTFQYAGPLVNNNNPQDLNSLGEVFSVVLIVMIFVVGNYSITTFMSGKGSFKEILIVVGYALWPAVIIGFPNVILSNFLAESEIAFYNLFMVLSYVLTGWVLFMGLLNIHEYGLGKSLLGIIATVVAMAIIIFIGLLFFDIIQQIVNFVAQIFQELRLR